MSVSRRIVLLGVAGTAATVGAASGPVFMGLDAFKDALQPAQGKGRRRVPLGPATADDWSLQKGTLFRIDTGQILELVDVRRFKQYPGRPRHLRPAAFVNTFEVKDGAPLTEERIYRFSHVEGGQFDLLLSRGAPDKPMRMLAVLN